MGIVRNEYNERSKGGTELLIDRLEASVPADLLEDFQIFPGRVRGELDPTKIRIFWAHDLDGDPEMKFLANEGWRQFNRIVFVSYMQQALFLQRFGIPPSRCIVMQNAIVPIPDHEKPDVKDGIRLIYTPTPHRGLNILAAVFKELRQKHDDILLDVYSSFALYGWEDRDAEFKPVFDELEATPGVTLHGTVSNDEVRQALQNSHIFAYPSTWPETSCMCLMEAMSADLMCVHSNLGALPETAAGWTNMYPMHEDASKHAGMLMENLDRGISYLRDFKRDGMTDQKRYADIMYSWERRGVQWTGLLQYLKGTEPRGIESTEPVFRYKVGV